MKDTDNYIKTGSNYFRACFFIIRLSIHRQHIQQILRCNNRKNSYICSINIIRKF